MKSWCSVFCQTEGSVRVCFCGLYWSQTVNLNRLFPSNTSRERQRHYESSTKAVARSVLLLDSVWSDLFSGLILSVRSSDAWIPWTPLWAFASCSWQNVDCCVSLKMCDRVSDEWLRRLLSHWICWRKAALTSVSVGIFAAQSSW